MGFASFSVKIPCVFSYYTQKPFPGKGEGFSFYKKFTFGAEKRKNRAKSS
jgi:hypothetical protein